MLQLLLLVLPLLLAVYALVDLSKTPAGELQGMPKLAWAVVIVLAWIVGPIAWLTSGRLGGGGLSSIVPKLHRPDAFTRPRGAADDDPDFLRSLGRRKADPPPPAETEKPAPPEDEPPTAAAI